MHQFLLQLGFSWQDWFALAFFSLAWLLYSVYSERGKNNLSNVMDTYRLQWMIKMTERDVRIVDTNIQLMQMRGATFFSSTSLLMVGGMVALLGATDQAFAVMADLPLIGQQSVAAWELKVVLMLLIAVYSFFKFAWAFRQFNYISILIGASPHPDAPEAQRVAFATQLGHLHRIAGQHQNKGIRAYYFGLAVMGWWLHPMIWIAVTLWVILVLYRREFLGQFRKALLNGMLATPSAPEHLAAKQK